MDALRRIKRHLTGETALSRELSESVFEFEDLDVVSLLRDTSVLGAKAGVVHELAECSELDIASLRALRQGLADIAELTNACVRRAKQHRETLSAVVGLFHHAGSLLNRHSMLTGLSSGFSLTGSRDRVHDDHFERMTVYSLSLDALTALEKCIRTLLAYGRLVPIADQTDDQALEIVNLVQSLLLAYGIGTSHALSYPLFISPPKIWLDCQEIALKAVKKVALVETLQAHSDLETRFAETVPLATTLLEEAMPSGEIKLEGFWGTKKGVDEIRSAVRLLVP